MPAQSGIVSMSKARIGVTSVGEDTGGEITIAAVADDGDDHRVLEIARDAQRNVHGAARRDAGENALLAREAPRHLLRLALAHVLEPIDALGLVDLGQVRLGPFADARDLRAFLRLAADDLDLRVLLLEVARAAHDRAGGAHAGHKMREAPVGVAPDLRAGRLVVDLRIGGGRELVRHRAFALAHPPLPKVARPLHAALL